MTTGSECCKLRFKAPEEGEEEVQEATARLAAANDISVDVAVAVV